MLPTGASQAKGEEKMRTRWLGQHVQRPWGRSELESEEQESTGWGMGCVGGQENLKSAGARALRK